MRRNLLRFVLTCGVGGLLLSTAAEGAVFALRAVKITRNNVDQNVAPAPGSGPGQELDVNSQTINVLPLDVITAELRIFNFPEMNSPNSDGARVYQTILANRAAATSGGNPAGLILPRGWDAPVTDSTIFCLSDFDCAFRPGLHCEGENPPNNPGRCQGNNHNPLGNNFFIDGARADFIHFGRVPPPVQQFVAAPDLDHYTVVSVMDRDDAAPGPFNNPTNDYYGGTIVYTVSEFACGTYTMGFSQDIGAHTLKDLKDRPANQTMTFLPLIIEMADCPPLIQSEDPPNCSIDARMPWTETEPVSNPIPTAALLGLRTPIFHYDISPAAKVPASYARRVVPLTGGVAPTISSVTQMPPLDVQLNLSQPIRIRAYTCIRQANSGIEKCWGFLPGDVSANGVTNALDIQDGREFLDPSDPNYQPSPPTVGAPTNDLLEWLVTRIDIDLMRCDMNRSGQCTEHDILTHVNMLVGSGTIGPGTSANPPVYNGTGDWDGETFLNNVVCPTPE
jgi:hypothetical protein